MHGGDIRSKSLGHRYHERPKTSVTMEGLVDHQIDTGPCALRRGSEPGLAIPQMVGESTFSVRVIRNFILHFMQCNIIMREQYPMSVHGSTYEAPR